MSSDGAIAVAGFTDNNIHTAKKRRRWSTAQQDAVLAPNRFGVKKQLRILGRHHPSSNSVNSLASFQSKSNPIFEPSEELPHKAETEFLWHSAPSNGPTLVTPLDALSSGGGGGLGATVGTPLDYFSSGGGGVESHPQPHPKPKSRLGKITPESSLLSNQPPTGGWGGEEESNPIGDPIQLPQSPAINGKSKRFNSGVLETSENDSGEGEWPSEEEDLPTERDDSLLLLTSSEGSSRCLIEEEMLSSLSASERRSRELVAKVEANAAAEIAQLQTYRAIIEQLRVDCSKQEAAAREWSDMHKDAMTQLVSARAEITELERQCGVQNMAIEAFNQKQGVEKDLQEALAISDRLKLNTLEKEQDVWRKRVSALETELMATRSELSAAEERREAEAASESDVATEEGGVVDKKAQEELEGGAENKGEIEDASLETKLTMERLEREGSELRIAVQDAERRVEEAHKERDSVVLAVQQEWDSVKTAIRQDKEKLSQELEVIREQNSKLQKDLDMKNKILEAEKRQEKAEQVFIDGKVIESGTERGDSLIALWKEYQKLEVELSEAFDHNKRQRSDREVLNVALVGVRNGNKRLEGELSDLQVEKTKLERERDDLMTAVQEERRTLENERAVVCNAMRGEHDKLESERAVLIAMQEYLKKLETRKDLVQPEGGDEKRRRKSKRPAAAAAASQN